METKKYKHNCPVFKQHCPEYDEETDGCMLNGYQPCSNCIEGRTGLEYEKSTKK